MSNEHVHPLFRGALAGVAPDGEVEAMRMDREEIARLRADVERLRTELDRLSGGKAIECALRRFVAEYDAWCAGTTDGGPSALRRARGDLAFLPPPGKCAGCDLLAVVDGVCAVCGAVEDAETRRAHSLLSDKQREAWLWLRGIR